MAKMTLNIKLNAEMINLCTEEFKESIASGFYTYFNNMYIFPEFDSSCYGKIGYDPFLNELVVGFKDKQGKLINAYKYYDVSLSFADALLLRINGVNMVDKSVGAWLRSSLKDFNYEKLESDLIQ